MFTGLVQTIGEVRQIEPTGAGCRLSILAPGWRHRPRVGDSICVSGVCLTLAEPASRRRGMLFDVVRETIVKTTLGLLQPGAKVNLEHALRADSLLGGHLVQGHVDGVGEVTRVQEGDDWRLRVRPRDQSLMHFVAPKGSITIDGVSLTVAALGKDRRGRWLEVALIPATLELTSLAALRPGDPVNLEMDMIAKSVVHYLREFAPSRATRGRGAPAGAAKRAPRARR